MKISGIRQRLGGHGYPSAEAEADLSLLLTEIDELTAGLDRVATNLSASFSSAHASVKGEGLRELESLVAEERRFIRSLVPRTQPTRAGPPTSGGNAQRPQ